MRSQAQYTIYSLNDVIASNTAPTSPYKGQLWVDTSTTPPVTKVYNGTSWVEQNGTDTIRTSITTLTTQQSSFQTSLNTLSSNYSAITTRVQTVEDDLGTLEETVETLQEDYSSLEQTASQISASVTSKASAEYGSSSSNFGWKLKSTGFYLYSGAKTVMAVTSSGATIGGCTIESGSLKVPAANITGTLTASQIDATGIVATNVDITGKITATSGSIENLTITGKLFFGGNTTYYINANYNDGDYYINLPGFRVDDASGAVFSGKLSAPTGNIGGCTITNGVLKVPAANITGTLTAAQISANAITVDKLNPNTFLGHNHGSQSDWRNVPTRCEIACRGRNYCTVRVGDDTSSTSIALPRLAIKNNYGSYVDYYDAFFGFIGFPNASDAVNSSGFNTHVGLIGIGHHEGNSDYLDEDPYSMTANCLVRYKNGVEFCGIRASVARNEGWATAYIDGTAIKIGRDWSPYAGMRISPAAKTVNTYGTWTGAVTGTYSDRNLKHDIEDLDTRYEILFDALRPKRFKYNDGTSNRYHTGFIAQDVNTAIEAGNLTTQELAAFYRWEVNDPDAEDFGQEYLALRYDEFVAINTWQIQRLKQRIAALESIINGGNNQ